MTSLIRVLPKVHEPIEQSDPQDTLYRAVPVEYRAPRTSDEYARVTKYDMVIDRVDPKSVGHLCITPFVLLQIALWLANPPKPTQRMAIKNVVYGVRIADYIIRSNESSLLNYLTFVDGKQNPAMRERCIRLYKYFIQYSGKSFNPNKKLSFNQMSIQFFMQPNPNLRPRILAIHRLLKEEQGCGSDKSLICQYGWPEGVAAIVLEYVQEFRSLKNLAIPAPEPFPETGCCAIL
jgi:hypothetical protein